MDSISAKFLPALKAVGLPAQLQSARALVAEASARRYYTLTFADGKTLVGVLEESATAQTNMPLVQSIQSFLKKGDVSVPEIIFTDVAAGAMLQQDLGDVSLNQALRENPEQAEVLYQQAIAHMCRWQRLPDDGTCPAFHLSFDTEKLNWEFNFFIEHTLQGYYGARLSDATLAEIREDFLKIAEMLAAPTNKVFTHRDYHSRNIMLVGERSRTDRQQYIIDFQDARLGLFQYDLCSLLYDAYAPLEKTLRANLIDFAFEQGKDMHKQSRGEFNRYLRLSAFQRLVKAMGTFGRQAALGRIDFEAYLEPAWQMLSEVTADDTELRGITFRLESLIEHQE